VSVASIATALRVRSREQVTDPSQPGLFEDGVLPVNSTSLWSGMGKLSWKPSPLQTLRFGGTVNNEDWQQYIKAYYDVNT
jgi:hypothetical protein